MLLNGFEPLPLKHQVVHHLEVVLYQPNHTLWFTKRLFEDLIHMLLSVVRIKIFKYMEKNKIVAYVVKCNYYTCGLHQYRFFKKKL